MRLRSIRFLVLIGLIILYSFACSLFQNYSIKKTKIDLNNDNSFKVLSNETTFEKEKNEESRYYARIIISKIKLDRILYPVGSSENNVDKNIEILKESNMPDQIFGNLILASHNGLSSVSYFHNLNKLEIGDEVTVSYNDNDYRYIISKIYDVEKTGKVSIRRDRNRTAITMITCKDDNKQLVVIGYLK